MKKNPIITVFAIRKDNDCLKMKASRLHISDTFAP